MPDAETAIDAYLGAWNEGDADARRRLLASALADECVLVAPTGRFQGLEAIDGLVVALRERMVGATIARTGPVVVATTASVGQDGSKVSFTWQVSTAAGVAVLSGTDEVEVAASGQLQHIHVAL